MYEERILKEMMCKKRMYQEKISYPGVYMSWCRITIAMITH